MERSRSIGRRLALRIATLALVPVLAGCVTGETFVDTQPVPAGVSRPNDSLRTLPPPRHRTTVAVYGLDDRTGQYKDTDTVQTLSRAVTQGGASVLIKALQDAGERRWFSVLERAELDNLLKERQIITEMRRLYRGEEEIDPDVLPPLEHAGIIIEGAIVGYDSNVVTGGAGARFLAIGGDTDYTQDVVTVTLRAVSTKSGEVLTSVTNRKAIASYALRGGAFRFVELDELLELEAGTTYNEPKQIAVESAVESAVRSLIIEGSKLGVWAFANEKAGREYIADYEARRYDGKYTTAALTRPGPDTPNAAGIQQTVPTQNRTVAATQVSANSRGSGAGRVQTQAPAQAVIRRAIQEQQQQQQAAERARQQQLERQRQLQRQREIQRQQQLEQQRQQQQRQQQIEDGNTQTDAEPRPADEPAERDLPPAPTPDEPAVGSNGTDQRPQTLYGLLTGA